MKLFKIIVVAALVGIFTGQSALAALGKQNEVTEGSQVCLGNPTRFAHDNAKQRRTASAEQLRPASSSRGGDEATHTAVPGL